MNKMALELILSDTNKVLMIKKASEPNVSNTLITSDKSMMGLLFFLKRKKFDYLIITKTRILYIIKNKVIKNMSYGHKSKLVFNAIKNGIELYINNQIEDFIGLKDFRVTQENIQQIKKALGSCY